MRVFRFRLQKVLELRRQARRTALRDVARAVNALRLEEERRDSLVAGRAATLETLVLELGDGRADGAGVALALRTVTLLERGLDRAEEDRRREEARLQQARATAGQTRVEYKAMERLRERALVEHREVRDREEAALLDEVASRRHAARQNRRTEA